MDFDQKLCAAARAVPIWSGIRRVRLGTFLAAHVWHVAHEVAVLTVEVREALKRGGLVEDEAFDAIYGSRARAASRCYWTPVAAAQAAAKLFAQAGCKHVLDVGSGVGKFAVIATLTAELEVHGVEHRAHLVHEARRAALAYASSARFSHAPIESITPRDYDGFYLFNPFGENLVHPTNRLDRTVPLGPPRYGKDVERVECWLSRAAVGTSIVTYNGFGGRVPGSFELVSSLPGFNCPLRLWTKRTMQRRAGSFFVEHKGQVLASIGAKRRGALSADDETQASRPGAAAAKSRS